MLNLPKKYSYLRYEPAPKMLLELLKLYGIEEVLGPGDSPAIMAWAKETKSKNYTHDSVAWCGLTIAIAAKRAGWECQPKGNGLWARNWAAWGSGQKIAMLGDVLVFPRGVGGHVTMYVGEDKDYYHCLGGNQSDMVNIVRKAKTPILAIRRAAWKRYQPDNVRRIWLGTTGQIATREK